MEHREVQALLEQAAVEPAGFERLMAGDTTEAAAVAGHLAGCPACAASFERLRERSAEIRELVRELPADDLRERTLARVAAEGRIRVPSPTPEPVGSAPSESGVGPRDPSRARAWATRRWALVSAAAVVVAVVGLTGWWWTAGRLDGAESTVATLTEMTERTAEIAAMPDARTIGLKGEASAGWLTFSAGSAVVAVQAEGLPAAGPGQEYRCWVEIDGSRMVIGPMWVDGDLAWWAGPAPEVASAGAGTVFGVSLVEVDGGQPGQAVMTGGVGGS